MTAPGAEMARLEAGPRGRGARRGGQSGLLKTLAAAATIALVAGPAFTVHLSARLRLPTPRTGPAIAIDAVGAAAAVTLEPLLPSGLF